VAVASALTASAPAGSVWVTRTVADLVAGLPFTFRRAGKALRRDTGGKLPIYEALVGAAT
jgi:hypothetical protein